jgi:DNA repair protein RecN (Recombination protein N)
VLSELAVTNLGVIDHVRLVLGPGMTALTGETGAGKTMLVEAIELLVGARADAALVRPGCDEATIEGRFVVDHDEIVLTRVIPAVGRSRGYVDGRLAPAGSLAEWGARLVDLHGQHTHQSLLTVATQRAALDRFGAVDLGPLRRAREELAAIDAALSALGGDERARAREIDLLRFQVAELTSAAVEDDDEDERLAAEEELLADAVAHREAAAVAVAGLTDESGALDTLGTAIAAIANRAPFAGLEGRLRALAAEATDVASELRALGELIADDPERVASVRARRQLLHDLRRKYGDSLREVMSFAAQASDRLRELESHDERAAALDAERVATLATVAKAAAAVGKARRKAAPALGAAVQANLAELAMAKAALAVAVGADDPGDDVAFLLAANPGSPRLPLAKVASGGELARAMLALRLVLLGDESGPPTLVFDEVDAGIGGAAANAVGRALAQLGAERQVLVVTHLAQVAACADVQVAVAKADDGATTTATVRLLDADERVVELSRMLSGSPESASAQEHAAELLEASRRPG